MSAVTGKSSSNNIKIGDVITLKFPKMQSYLSAEGIIVEDVQVSQSLKFFEEHLFQVYVQRQYSATNELEELTMSNQDDPFRDIPTDQGSINHLEALMRGKENETLLNKAVMKNKTLNELRFGDTIQLLHIKSKKYVTVQPNDLARDERENMKVTLSTDGSVMSWIKVMPRYKINREGEPIKSGTEVLLKVSERSNEYLHCADRAPPRSKLREVNSSLEVPTPWRISLFQRVEDAQQPSKLLAGELVYIRDPESQCMLAPVSRPMAVQSPSAPPPPSTRLNSPEARFFESPWSSDKLNAAAVRSVSDADDESSRGGDAEEDDDVSVSSVDEFIGDHGEVALKPMEEEALDSDALWMLESRTIAKGGAVRWKADLVHFRHFNTGKYLCMRARDLDDDRSSHLLFLDGEPSDADLFSVVQLHSNSEFLNNAKAVQLKHDRSGAYIERGPYMDSQRVHACSTTRMKSKGVNVIINRYRQREPLVRSRTVGRAAEDEVQDVYFGKAVVHHLRRFVRQTVVPAVPGEVSTIWPKVEAADRILFSMVLTYTAFFVKGYPTGCHSNASIDLSKFKTDSYTIARRQNMLREQGLVQDLITMLSLLQPLANWLTADHNGAAAKPGNVVEAAKEVLSECLNLLYDVIRGNLANQLYIADHLLVVLAHVSTDRMAAKVARELLSSNRELQETKIGLREITIFAEKMCEVPMNAMYLQLLQTCCSCLGQGVPKNQEVVNQVVFHRYSDILIAVNEVSHKLVKFDWTPIDGTASMGLYVTPYLHDFKGGMKASQLVTAGMPTVSLSWSSKSSRFQANRLFSRTPVAIGDMFRPYNHLPVRRVSATGRLLGMKDAEYRMIVADFFVAQLHLAAEMCLGRNYPVMRDMESFYSYELLVTLLQSSHSDQLKAAVASLLLTLYIDRDPQSPVQLPRLTRTLTEISRRGELSCLLCVDSARVGEFGLVQFIISQHLSSIRGKPFPPHSYNLMKVLHKLVAFNFYGQADQLKETIALLVVCLGRDETDLDNTVDTNAALYQSMKRITSAGNTNNSRRLSLRSVRSAVSNTEGGGGDQQLGKDNSFVSIDNDNQNTMPDIAEAIAAAQRSWSWQGRFDAFCVRALQFTESSASNALMVAIVALAVAASLEQVLTGIDHWGFLVEDWVVLGVYGLRLVLHFLLHIKVRKNLLTFLSSIYNWLDIASVAVYLAVMLLMPHTVVSRLIKCVGFQRAFALMKSLYDQQLAAMLLAKEMRDSVRAWTEPDRYFKTTEYTLTTLVKIVQILCTIQKSIEDRQLTAILRRFHEWTQDSRGSTENVHDVLVGVLSSTSDIATSSDAYDDQYIDLLMYSHAPLVQVTLELLMIHHSSTKILLENVTRLQLITSEEGESQYGKVEAVLKELQRDADTHEMWGKLLLPAHRETSARMLKSLNGLMEDCRERREVLKFDESYQPVKVSQNILRNLGCFDLCLKITQLIAGIDPNDSFAECHINTRNLALASNRLMYWFILDNPANQFVAFSQLRYFIRTIDAKVGSDKVISAIFRGNLELMESVPKKYISDFADLICNTGRFPQYLALMSSIIAVGDKNVIANQYEVIKRLCSPENQKKVVMFFVPVSHPDYANKKIKLMNHYLAVKDVTVDELPSDLAYHLDLLGLLSSCTIGRSGMTTIEAKVQSMFSFVDLVEAMLDPNCLLLARIRYGLFLYNAVIDVETPLPALKDADCIWRLIISTQEVFTFAKDELRQVEKNGWDSPTSNRQKIEYMLVCAEIVHGYFSLYYDHTIFKQEMGQTALGVERMQLKEPQANEVIQSLFAKISLIYEMVSPLLAEEHHRVLYDALVSLNDAAKDPLVDAVEDIHSEFLQQAREYSVDCSAAALEGKSFESFTMALLTDESVRAKADAQVQTFIAKLESLPWKDAEEASSSVRFEPLIEKIVSHIRGTIQMITHGDETVRFVDREATKTGIWMIRIFRTMIENRWGMSIYERDDEGGEEQDDAVVSLMEVFNASGVTEMCLDMISKGVDISLQSEALKLLVGMLFKEGGALDLQKTIHAHLSKPGSDMFFGNVRTILHNLIAWHRWNGIIVLKDDAEPALPDEFILVRCLQLMCEGHYGPNQDIMREQPNNVVSINLLDTFVEYLQALDDLTCRTSTTAELAVCATVLEVIQGPCIGNQDYFALSTELIETLNRKMRQHPMNDCDESQEIDLKKSVIDIFQGLLEGQGRRTAVYERMLSVIHLDVIHVLSMGEGGDGAEEGPGGSGGEKKEESGGSLLLRTECLVLMQMLTDFRPSLKRELAMEERDDDKLGGMDASVACVELVWRGELQRRFFHVPSICKHLAKSSKDNFIMYVKRASPEDKLYGLLEATRDMYREVLHQSKLKEYRVDGIFSRTNQDRAAWANFFLVLAINVLFVVFYTTVDVDCSGRASALESTESAYAYSPYDDYYYSYRPPTNTTYNTTCTDMEISSAVSATVLALNVALIALAAFGLLLYLVVRVVVNYHTLRQDGAGLLKAAVYTAADVNTFYYTAYLTVALLGLQYHVALTLLLLDFISKSPTSQSVLQAVSKPWKQLFFTVVLACIIIYIFAMFQFTFFNTPEDFSFMVDVETLLNTFKFLLRWGFPYGAPENYMEQTVSTYRVFSDILFFVATMLMLNILKGITIDTFVELRKDLEARVADTTEKCFICGIDKNTFNRTLDRDAFRTHTRVDQNLWNYVYFIIYIWEQDKDDDDGLESYVRRCVADQDLVWFPMNKAIRLAEHHDKGDVNSLKYRFRKDLQRSEGSVQGKMQFFKDQLNRTIARVEKALEFEAEAEAGMKTRRQATARLARSFSNSGFGIPTTPQGGVRPGRLSRMNSTGRLLSDSDDDASSRGRSRNNSAELFSNATLNSALVAAGDVGPRTTRLSAALHASSSFNVMDADTKCQMHMRVMTISGLNLRRENLGQVVVRVWSEFAQVSVRPMEESEQDVGTFLRREGSFRADSGGIASGAPSPIVRQRGIGAARGSFSQSAAMSLRDSFSSSLGGSNLDKGLLRFDLMGNPSLLVHEGALPKVDLSKIVVKMQVLLLLGRDRNSDSVCIASADIPFVNLLSKAELGGVLEVAFEQRAYEVPELSSSSSVSAAGSGELRLQDVDDSDSEVGGGGKTVFVPDSPFCVVTVSAMASHVLLKDWAAVNK